MTGIFNFLVFFVSILISKTHAIEDKTPIWPYPSSYSENKDGKIIEFSKVSYKLYDLKTKKFIPIENDKFVKSMVSRYSEIIGNDITNPIKGCDGNVCEIKNTKKVNEIEFLMRIEDVEDKNFELNTKENYTMSISEEGNVVLSSETVYGALRGMESFSQLVNSKSISNLPINIKDSPRYQWRGVMLDTSRHYLTLDSLRKTIDAMQANKLNTLHLHLTDAQSFPLVIEQFPLLAEKGAYHPKYAIYTKQNLKDLVAYGLERGVRIYPEIDIPGHAAAFGKGYPSSVAKCPSLEHNINNVALNPINSLTKDIVLAIVKELKEIFPDTYQHYGGDELAYGCWKEDPEISAYMKKEDISGIDLNSLFMQDIYKNLGEKVNVCWEERATEKAKYPMPSNSIVQVWRALETLKDVSEMGFKFLNSAGWYADRMTPRPGMSYYLMLDVWESMYSVELSEYYDTKYDHNCLGGEIPMWAEQISNEVLIPRLFPKASAVAERLWSPKEINFEKFSIPTIRERLIHHICHNHISRGIPASPIRPDYCPAPQK